AHGVASHFSLADRGTRGPLALAIWADSIPPGRTVVARSQFFAWFLRPSFLGIRPLAGTYKMGAASPSALVDRARHPSPRPRHTRHRTDGRRTLPGAVFLVNVAGWHRNSVPRLELFPHHSVPARISDPHDPDPGDCLQSNHIPTAVARLARRRHRPAVDGSSRASRRQRDRPAHNGAR